MFGARSAKSWHQKLGRASRVTASELRRAIPALTKLSAMKPHVPWPESCRYPMTRSILTIVFPQRDEKGTGPIQPETLARHVDVARRESRKDSAGNPSFVTSWCLVSWLQLVLFVLGPSLHSPPLLCHISRHEVCQTNTWAFVCNDGFATALGKDCSFALFTHFSRAFGRMVRRWH